MNKIILIPDSFKGTMTSAEICDIMADALGRAFPRAEIVRIPVADGGEGSVDCFLAALGGKRVPLRVTGPFGQPVEAFYGLPGNGEAAVVEMAAAAGLPLAEGRLNPLLASTYGVGQLLLAAAQSGAARLVLGLGGSATNDGGCGAAAALGVRFYGRDGASFVPTGGTLADIARIDVSRLDKALSGMDIVAMCDVDNPLAGPNGAAAVFGPQKGASAEMLPRLDAGLAHLADVIRQDLGLEVANTPGSGAAGGFGAGVLAFLGGRLQMGIETVLDTVHFNTLLQNASVVITGEGKLDSQSLRGKVVVGVARRARAAGVPVVAVVGDIGDSIEAVYGEGVSAVFSINRVAVPYAQAKTRAKSDLALTMQNLARAYTVFT